ncbi:helix-turn-helix transcriptional regulator [Pseudomarimonas salicorniae]|uniref:Response regulator transcription factor n=1 Tax=Pseudomarimonas salicorniae TaxID=2933270 RepID=A0ABT0GGG2_9GAMM|nr:response regulator transcription factor [Lysobacter sp. CAU 1642]
MSRELRHAVWVVDRDRRRRRGLARCIEAASDLRCVLTVPDTASLDAALDARPAPPLLLLGCGRDGDPGPRGLRRVQARCPTTRLLVIGGRKPGPAAVAAIEAGARGFLLRPVQGPRIIEALHALLRGAAPIDPALTACLLDRWVSGARAQSAVSRFGLSPRESEVLALLGEGLSVEAIAERLARSRHTVSNHLRRVYAKLRVHSRAQAVARAQQGGLP